MPSRSPKPRRRTPFPATSHDSSSVDQAARLVRQTARVVGAAGGSPAEALAESAFALRASVDSLRGYESEGWAHFDFTRINTAPTILRKKIEDRSCVCRALRPQVLSASTAGSTCQRVLCPHGEA